VRFAFVISFLACALQLSAENVDCPGKIVYDSQTIDVVFSIPLVSPFSLAYHEMEAGVVYYDEDQEQVLLLPGGVKEIQFLFDDEEIKLKSLMYLAADGNIASVFLKVVMEGGEVNVYQQYYPPVAYTFPVANTLGATRPTEWIPEGIGYVLQKRNEAPKFCGMALGFRKVMRKYFRDCPSLADLIKHRAFKKDDVLTIAKFYNTRCNQ
jgi:hypothetical protein